jgi:small subunit ribosomal protein S4e
VTAVEGSHSGEIGRVEEVVVTPGSAPNNVIASQDDVPGVSGDGFETVEEYVVVIDENFTDEDSDAPDDAAAEESDDADATDDDESAEADDGGDDE